MLSAVIAGINRLSWGRFLCVYGAASMTWAGLYGFGAFFLGRHVEHLARPFGTAVLIVVVVGTIWAIVGMRRYAHKLLADAERAYPAGHVS
jgi:membrane protein DedA with SNARE-associated domain